MATTTTTVYSGTYGGEATGVKKTYSKTPIKSYQPPSGSQGATTSTAVITESGFNVVSPNMFGPGAMGTSIADQWESFVGRTGIADLEVAQNWWPGLNLTDQWTPVYQEFGRFIGPEQARMYGPEAWAAPSQYVGFEDPDSGATDQFWVRYDPTRAAQQYMLMGDGERERYSKLMADAGLIAPEFAGIGDYTPEGANAFAQALSWANYWGRSVEKVLTERGKLMSELRRRSGGGRGSGAGPQVKIEVPDYETLVAQSKDLLTSKLGRDPRDWEMTLLAEEMGRQYGNWADATRARMLGGNGTYEIPDPNVLSETFVENKWATELERIGDVADQRTANQVLVAALTKGTQMMGGIGG